MSSGAPGGPTGAAGDVVMAPRDGGGGGEYSRFRRTLMRVLAVQVVTLALLWLLQATYHG